MSASIDSPVRHEALTQTVELIAAVQLKADKRMVVLEERTTQLMETVNRLANIIIAHEERMLEDQ